MFVIRKQYVVKEQREVTMTLSQRFVKSLNMSWDSIYVDTKPKPVITMEYLLNLINNKGYLPEDIELYQVKCPWQSEPYNESLSEWCWTRINETLDDREYDLIDDKVLDTEIDYLEYKYSE